MNRICYQISVTKGQPQPLTEEMWNKLIDNPNVKSICRQIAELDELADDYNDRKQALKRQLPVILPHASAFKNGKRISADAIPSGLAMLDVDHVDNPREWFESVDRETLINNRICLVSITASGHGLRIIGERSRMLDTPSAGQLLCREDSTGDTPSIEQTQTRMAEALGITEYDAVTKDLARASYIVPRDYILWMDTEMLLAMPQQAVSTPSAGQLLCREDSTGDTPPSSLSPLATSPAEAEMPLAFKDVPYRDIVSQLMIAMGNADGAIQGERNTVYFSLANYMRYICDFNAALLLQVLPDFNLSREERLAAIHSALGRPRKSQIPTILQGAIAVCQRDQEHAASSLSPLATSLAMPPLPPLLRTICRRIPTGYRPAMIIAALPVLGTLATRVRFQYIDQQTHSFSFFSCITAPAASGKSFIRKPVDLLLTPINEQDAIEREKEQQYKDALRAHKNSKIQPQDPHACPRNNGISISIAKLLQLLTYAEGKHLIGIGEEMDTLVKSERAGVWSQKSDIYRLAFDNAEYGQAYMSDNSFTAHIPVYYNLLLTGTPNSMKRFFKDLENGMVTRVCFAKLPDTSFSEIPTFPPYSPQEQEQIIHWARVLDAESGTIECPQIGRVISEWLEEKRQLAIDSDSHAADTFRRRAAVIGFRAGMLCFLLEGHRYTNTVCRFTKWVAEYVFRNQMELWGDRMEREMSTSFDASTTERGAASSLLALLNQEFTTAELIAVRARNHQSVTPNSIKTLLSRWKANGRIEKISDGKWKKLR